MSLRRLRAWATGSGGISAASALYACLFLRLILLRPILRAAVMTPPPRGVVQAS